MASDYQFLFKIVLVGDSGVGKTSLLLRYTDGTYTDNHIATIGIDFKIKTLDFANDGKAKLQVWDTAGQDRFKTIVSSFYRGAHGFVVVFDVTDMESFEHVKQWFKEGEEYGNKETSRLLIGNKSDLSKERVVSTDMAQALANQMGIPYIETSAKSTTNVEQAFTSIARALVEVTKAKGHLVDGPNGHLSYVPITGCKRVSDDSRRIICC